MKGTTRRTRSKCDWFQELAGREPDESKLEVMLLIKDDDYDETRDAISDFRRLCRTSSYVKTSIIDLAEVPGATRGVQRRCVNTTKWRAMYRLPVVVIYSSVADASYVCDDCDNGLDAIVWASEFIAGYIFATKASATKASA